MPICRDCGKEFVKYDKKFNVICKKCKQKTLKKLNSKSIFSTNYFNKQMEQGIDYFFEYKIAPELNWINNKRFSTDYWMYS